MKAAGAGSTRELRDGGPTLTCPNALPRRRWTPDADVPSTTRTAAHLREYRPAHLLRLHSDPRNGAIAISVHVHCTRRVHPVSGAFKCCHAQAPPALHPLAQPPPPPPLHSPPPIGGVGGGSLAPKVHSSEGAEEKRSSGCNGVVVWAIQLGGAGGGGGAGIARRCSL